MSPEEVEPTQTSGKFTLINIYRENIFIVAVVSNDGNTAASRPCIPSPLAVPLCLSRLQLSRRLTRLLTDALRWIWRGACSGSVACVWIIHSPPSLTVVTSMIAVSPLFIFEFLHRCIDVFLEYFGKKLVRGVRDTRHALALAPCSESRARGSSRVLACAHRPL